MEITKAKFMEAFEMTEENHDIELRENYSGRGMYSKTTMAVIGDTEALAEFESTLALLTVTDDLYDTIPVSGMTVLEALTDMADIRHTDNMGLDKVVYYPSLKITE